MKLHLEDLCDGAFVRCNYCHGTGQEPYYRDDCCACKGTGQLLGERGEMFFKFMRKSFEEWLRNQPEEPELVITSDSARGR